jgi:hypothetical protein
MRSRVDANQLVEMRRLLPDLGGADEVAVQFALPLSRCEQKETAVSAKGDSL